MPVLLVPCFAVNKIEAMISSLLLFFLFLFLLFLRFIPFVSASEVKELRHELAQQPRGLAV